MRVVEFAAAAAVLSVGSAAVAASSDSADASSSALAPAFKGTIISTYPDGRQGKLWLNEDGSYRAEGRKHDPSSGTWKVKGSEVCLKQSKPIGAPFSFCTPMPSGESWTAKAVTGEPIKVRVVPGGRA